MNHFVSIEDVSDPMGLVKKSIEIKKNPYANTEIGRNKNVRFGFF